MLIDPPLERGRSIPSSIIEAMWAVLLGFLFSLFASAQTTAPVVRNIRYYGLTHSSIRWVLDTDLPCYQVKYGVVSGVYPYTSNSFCDTQKAASLIVGGLAPATTYYFRITVRPDADDDTGICQIDACGSPEFVVTTLPEPSPHPRLPAPPLSWTPVHPDTSGYLVIPMMHGGTDGTECVAGGNVPAAQVQMGDNIDTILNEVPYGTVVEFPQGIRCVVPAARNSGYVLPVKPVDPAAQNVDSPNHKWIVLRTAAGSSGDFPPFGARTGSAWAPKLAQFVAVKPTQTSTDSTSAGKGRAQIFSAEDGGGQHHFWLENLEFTTTADPALLPATDAVDPVPYSALFGIFPTFSDRLPPDVSYIVLDRVFFYGQGFPSRYNRAVMLGGRYQAMIGCSLENLDYWRITVAPLQSATVSADGATLLIPPATFALNAQSPPTGTTAAASATLSASPDYQGQYVLQIGPEPNMLRLLYSAPALGSSVTIHCSGCTAVSQTPISVAYNGYAFCSGTIAKGQYSAPNCALANWQNTQYGYGWGTIGLELMDGGTGPYYLANNLFGAVGMGVYVDAGGDAFDFSNHISYADNSNDDTVFVHNHFIWGEDHRFTSPQSNGFRYPVRNLLETKRSRRWNIAGNMFQHFWSYQNDGAAILLSGAADPYAITNAVTGILDVSISSNVIRHGATSVEAGGALAQFSAGEQPGSVLIENNLMYDLAARLVYSDGDPSLYTGILAAGFRDLVFRHNTAGLTFGDMPVLLFADPSAALMEGLSFTDNLVYMSSGGVAAGILSHDGSGILSHLRMPRVDITSYRTMLDTTFVRLSSSGNFVPNYVFTRNVIIGGKTYQGSGQQQVDMPDVQIQALAANFPPGNTFPLTGTNSLSDRENMVGVTNSEAWNYRLLPSSSFAAGAISAAPDGSAVGVDYGRLESELGLVTNILPVAMTGNAAQFQYTAPDENSCAVDVTSDGLNWTRTLDGGGNRTRIVNIPQLNPLAGYRYRIICYYLQLNDGNRYTDYTSDQITSGTFGAGPIPPLPSGQTTRPTSGLERRH